jgi:hypothetical protein
VNGTKYGGYEKVDTLALSADGTKYGFAYGQGGKWVVNVNGTGYGEYDYAWSPKFSADGMQFGFFYKKGGKYYINVNGAEQKGPYSGLAKYTFNKKNVMVIAEVKGDYLILE